MTEIIGTKLFTQYLGGLLLETPFHHLGGQVLLPSRDRWFFTRQRWLDKLISEEESIKCVGYTTLKRRKDQILTVIR
jgi:hypothetical protein